MMTVIRKVEAKALLCPCCGAELPITGEPPPLDFTGCPRCGAAIQVPLRPSTALWFQRVEDESILPLHVVNKIAERRDQLRRKALIPQ